MGWRYEMRRKVERRILAWLLGLVTLLGIPRAGSASDDEGEFILRCSPKEIHEIVRRHGLTLLRSHESQDIHLVRAPASAPPQQVLSDVRSDPDVQGIEADIHVMLPEAPAGLRPDQSTASILDQQTILILNQSTASILDQSTASILDTRQVPQEFGHGTMVAGIIHLVAPTAQIMPLKAFKADGTASLFEILRAIYYAVDHGAKVINMSFSTEQRSAELKRAINYAVSRGVICVSSAGNNGARLLVYPAAFDNVLGVGSTSNLDARSTFSNFGDQVVTLAAPGEGIITTYPGGHYAAAWGTSFSTAFVSGGAALLLQMNTRTNQEAAADALEGNAKQLPDRLGLGEGRIDLYRALMSVIRPKSRD